MATKTLTVCDFDVHDPAEDVLAVHSRSYMVNGEPHDIDLCNDCEPLFAEFLSQMGRWASCSRLSPKQRNAPAERAPRPQRGARTNSNHEENAAIRQWAKSQPDIELAERGRIADSIRQRYRQWVADGRPQPEPEPQAQPRPVPAPPPAHTPSAYRGPYVNGQPEGFNPLAVHST